MNELTGTLLDQRIAAQRVKESSRQASDLIAQMTKQLDFIKSTSIAAEPRNFQQRHDSELARNAILRNIFQTLVVASGVDWAADAALLQTMLSLEDAPSS